MRVKVGREWRELGPGAAGGVDGLAALSRFGALDVVEPGAVGDRAPIERRQATEAERAAWRAPKPSALERRQGRFSYTADEIRERAHRGGEANLRRITSEREPAPALVTLVDPPVIPEERAMPDPMSEALQGLASSAETAKGSWERRLAADADWVIDRRELRGALEAAQRVLAADGEPEPPAARAASHRAPARAPRRSTSADPAGLRGHERRVLDALVAAKGDKAAAAAQLGMKLSSVHTAVKTIRDVGGMRLTTEEALVVAKRRG